MHPVPHLSFEAEFASDTDTEFGGPPGVAFARVLEAHLRSQFRTVDDLDLWRDIGWVVVLRFGNHPFEVYFSQFGTLNTQWLLAVAPLGQPGFFGRILGRKPFDCAAGLKAITREVHLLIAAMPNVSKVKWFFGGPPGKVPTEPTPEQLPWH